MNNPPSSLSSDHTVLPDSTRSFSQAHIANSEVLRASVRASIPRRSVSNLVVEEASSYAAHAAVVKGAIQSPGFMTFLDRALQRQLSSTYTHLVNSPLGKESALLALREAAIAIVERAATHFDAQRQHPKFSPTKEVTPYTTFTPPRMTAGILEPILEAHVASAKVRPQMVGLIRHALKDAVSVALVVEGLTKREDALQRSMLNVAALHLPYLLRPELQELDGIKSSAKPAKVEGLGARARLAPAELSALKIGRAAQHQDPTQVRDFLVAIEGLPTMNNTATRDQVTGQTTRRLQRALAELLVRHPSEPISREHFATVEIFRKVLSDPTILFHPHHHDNDGAIVDAVFRGLKAGSITLAAASCPDYSGTYSGDGKSRVWSYDFQRLGTGPGHVATRGLAYVAAWHRVLSAPEFFGANVNFVHWEGTFEVAEGFKGKGEGGEQLSHQEAVCRLHQSGLAVAALYAQRGIPCTSRLTNEAIPDAEFTTRKLALGEQILAQSGVDRELEHLLQGLAAKRAALYVEWFPPQEGESDSDYTGRIAREIVPTNIAEYQLLGNILHGSGAVTLVLAYDSPNMAEVYARMGLPVMSGQDRNATTYMGA